MDERERSAVHRLHPPGRFDNEWMADLYPETDVQIIGALSRDEAINMALDLWSARVSEEQGEDGS